MMDNIDGFPKIPNAEEPGKSNQSERVTAFKFGGDDDEDDAPELDTPPAADDPAEDSPPPIPHSTAPVLDMPETHFAPALDSITIAAAAEHLLEDLALKAISNIGQQRFLNKPRRVEEHARINRRWLDSLPQRDFFLAMGYPGIHILQLLDGFTSLGQIRAWVNGLETMPPLHRRVLSLEYMLDRRTLANRQKMPSRFQIEEALRAMPDTGDVSQVLGGFDALAKQREEKYPESPQVHKTGTERVSELLGIVKPGNSSGIQAPRAGSSLPISKRKLGKGRPLGERLLKPDPYCYSISRKSHDANGMPTITPKQAMELVNKLADLEREFNCLYSMRRKNTRLPWALDNIEMLPTDELERQRDIARRRHNLED